MEAMTKPKKEGSGTESGYNGWANYETWNVALWIENDNGLYDMARRCRHQSKPYQAFVEQLKELGGKIALHTPDGVAWNDSGLDHNELNIMIEEL